MALMLEKVLLVKYGEIVLKGLNKSNFEQMLENNIKKTLRHCGCDSESFRIAREQSVMVISRNTKSEKGDSFDAEKIVPILSKVFGIAAINLAVKTEKNMDALKEAAREYVSPLLAGKQSFAVDAKRSDKSFPLKSPAIAAEIGGLLHDMNDGIKVDLTSPEIKITVEIRDRDAFVHTKSYRGAGGMPVGSNGRGLLLLSGGIDSPVAGYMMARRGMKISSLHFTSEPYTSPRSKEKVMRLSKIISEYCGHIDFYSVSLTEIQEQIKKNCNEDYLTLILRRFMMELAEKLVLEQKFNCIITGESLGQVASQTIEAINATNNGIQTPILRPCIGFDKYQIVEIAQRIRTYETSIEPYEDCCTVFTPRHPVTRPKLNAILEEERKLDREALIREAYDKRELIKY